MAGTAPKKDQAINEIDTRIYSLAIDLLNSSGDIDVKEILGYMRACYTKGYVDCLKEDPEERGKWIKDAGYGVSDITI